MTNPTDKENELIDKIMKVGEQAVMLTADMYWKKDAEGISALYDQLGDQLLGFEKHEIVAILMGTIDLAGRTLVALRRTEEQQPE